MQNLVVKDCLARELMSSDVLSVYEGWSIKRLADFFLNHGISGAPVIASDHQLVGVVSVSDIFKFENASGEVKSEALQSCYRNATGIDIASRADLVEWSKNAEVNCTVHQIMAQRVITVEADSNITDIANVLVSNAIHRAFVIEDKKIVGVISSTDLLRSLLPQAGKEAQSVPG